MRFSAESFSRSCLVVVLGVGLSLSAGCPGSGGPKSFGKSVPVKGKVTYNSKTLPAGNTITFFHTERSFPASAAIEADGSYTLLFNGKPAVPVGTYKVAIAPPAGSEVEAAPPDPSNPEAYKAYMMKKTPVKAAPAASKLAFPKKYTSADSSGVTFTVVEEPMAYDVNLKD